MNTSSTYKILKPTKIFFAAVFVFLIVGVGSVSGATTYYSAGNNAPNLIASWWANNDGTGAHPASFATAGNVYVIQSGHTMTTTGTWTVSGTLSTIQINTGGTLVASNAVTATVMTVASGATYQHNQNGGTIPTATWDSNSTLLITGVTNLIGDITGFNTQNFGNVTWNCPGQSSGNSMPNSNYTFSGTLTIASTGSSTIQLVRGSYTGEVANYIQTGGSTFIGSNSTSTKILTVDNDFVLTGGTFDMDNGDPSASSTFTLNIGGNFSMNSGTFKSTSSSANRTCPVYFDGATTQVFSKTSGSISGSIDFTINSGSTVDFGTSLLDGSSGNFTLVSGGNLITANTGGIAATGATGTIQLTGTRTFNSGANYTYNGTSAQITGTGLTNPDVVTISNNAGVTFSAATAMSTLIISSGAKANLGTFTGHTASALFLNGTGYNSSTWGSSGSGATNKNDTYFVAPSIGILTLGISQYYSTSTSIKIPCGVTSLTVEVWGGGGGGSTLTSIGNGGGGGGGAYSSGVITVIPGNYYPITVGGGGTSGSTGSDSWFSTSSTVMAKGGIGVTSDKTAGANGGLASAGYGTTRYDGGKGADGSGTYGGGGGSSAGSAAVGNPATNATGATAPSGGGNGGAGKNGSTGSGSSGLQPGGGGGGAYKTGSGTTAGGSGGNGMVKITYNAFIPTITLGSNPIVYQGNISANLTFSAIAGCPDLYSIDYDVTAESVGFVDVSYATLPATPITLTVPASAAVGVYNGILTVMNSNTGIPSGNYAITVTINPNYWNGTNSTSWNVASNWASGIVPADGSNITFASAPANDLVLNVDHTIGNLTNTSAKQLYIPAGKCLTANIITNNSTNQIYIQASSTGGANGSLIFHNGSGSPVQGTVEMYSIAYWNLTNSVGAKYKWQFFGIPVHSLASTSPTFDGAYVRQLHENDSPAHWEQLNNASGLTSFTGYEITQAAAKIYVFQGQLENSNYSATLPYSSLVTYPGQSLIGNPYTAAIEISKIVFGSKMLKTVYIYNTGSYNDWQLAGSGNASDSINTNTTPGQYTAVPQAQAGNAGLQHQIPSMQAFLVRAQANDVNATLSIPYSSVGTVVGDSIAQRVKGLPVKESPTKVWTTIDVKGSRFADKMWIFSDPYCSHNFDNGWDGEKFFGSALAPQIFAMEADGNYQVNSVNDMNNTDIGFWAGVDTNYTLTFTNQNFSLQYSNLYLHDLQENTITDITQSGTSYSFTALPTDSPVKRFNILTRSKNTDTSFESPNAENKQLKIFNSQDNIFVHNSSNMSGNLKLYDISGRCIQNKPFIANGVTTIPMNLPAGIYIAMGTTANQEVTERLLIR